MSEYTFFFTEAKDPAQWKGQNLLGKILTELRDQLLAEK